MSNPARVVCFRGAAGLAAALAATTFAGCGSSSRSATSKTTFCSDVSALASVGNSAQGESMPQLAQTFKAHSSLLDNLKSSAPSSVKASASAVVNDIEAFINSGGTTNFNDPPSSVINAGNSIDSYCGTDALSPTTSTPS